MSKGFSRQDELIKRLKNCLGTLPDQQVTNQKSQLSNIGRQHSYLPQEPKQQHYPKVKQRKFLQDNRQQHSCDLKNQKRDKRQQLFLQDKYKKRNQYYKQKHSLADITNIQYSARKVRKHEQVQFNYSQRKGDANYKPTYNTYADKPCQQKQRENRRGYSNFSKDPTFPEQRKQISRKNYINQFMKLQLSNQKQNQKQNAQKKYKSSRLRPVESQFYEQYQKQMNKQPLRLNNNNNIGSIRRKRRECGKIADNILNDAQHQLSQSNVSLKNQLRNKQNTTVESQLKNYFCKNCGSKDSKITEKVQVQVGRKQHIVFKPDADGTAEKLKKISQLNDKINARISNIVETFQKSTEALYSKLYSKQ